MKHTCKLNEWSKTGLQGCRAGCDCDRQTVVYTIKKKKHALGKWRLHFSGQFAEAASQELWTLQLFCESSAEMSYGQPIRTSVCRQHAHMKGHLISHEERPRIYLDITKLISQAEKDWPSVTRGITLQGGGGRYFTKPPFDSNVFIFMWSDFINYCKRHKGCITLMNACGWNKMRFDAYTPSDVRGCQNTNRKWGGASGGGRGGEETARKGQEMKDRLENNTKLMTSVCVMSV